MAIAVPNNLLFKYMPTNLRKQTWFFNAFFSNADKKGVPELAAALHERDIKIYSAGGTAKAIAEKCPVTDIATLPGGVGGMLNHRLLTLQPVVHGPLLTSYSKEDDDELTRAGYPTSFDLVFIDLYPFDKLLAQYKNAEISGAKLWEGIDVGGPAMLKSAFKGKKFPIVSRERREWFLPWLDHGCRNFEHERRASLQATINLVAEREAAHAAFYSEYLSKLPSSEA